MSKLQAINFLLLGTRRSYGAAAENRTASSQQPMASVIRKAEDNLEASCPEKKNDQVFWMKEPKTGNWIPETHFDEIDAVELRKKFLPKKEASSN